MSDGLSITEDHGGAGVDNCLLIAWLIAKSNIMSVDCYTVKYDLPVRLYRVRVSRMKATDTS